MFGSLRHDIYVAGAQDDRRLGPVDRADSNIELPVENEEKLIGVLMNMPDVLAQGMGR